MSLTFFSEGGSNRPPRIPKFFFRGGSRGSRGSTGGKSDFRGEGVPYGVVFGGLGGRFIFYLIELIFQALNAYRGKYFPLEMVTIPIDEFQNWKLFPTTLNILV